MTVIIIIILITNIIILAWTSQCFLKIFLVVKERGWSNTKTIFIHDSSQLNFFPKTIVVYFDNDLTKETETLVFTNYKNLNLLI